ncbi:hypothetical protein K438DRAFT_1960050 [Mycena galopus ATCC 62051]|nr:hypothetical protein K438DRAFT_1960050 [Mycena galopus ATCC 62051]
MPRPLPPLTPDKLASVEISVRRALDLVAEAAQERINTHAADLRGIDQEWRDLGSPLVVGSWWAEQQLTREAMYQTARNCELALHPGTKTLSFRLGFFQYFGPRERKYLHARLRRYYRLRYQYELQHPPFNHPPLPLDRDDHYPVGPGWCGWAISWGWGWGADPLLSGEDDECLSSERIHHELQHLPFTHPDFPAHPSRTMWKQGYVYDEGSHFADYQHTYLLTETDDDISPVRMPIPLPSASPVLV